VETIPHLNHDQLVYLALHLAFETKLNDKKVWRCLEEAALVNLHLYSVTEMCQLEWATTQLKPKQVTSRINTMLLAAVLEKLHECNADELMHIMQGFRGKQNKGLYRKLRTLLIDGKQSLGLKGGKMIDLLYMFATFRPKDFGVYRVYAAEELDEMLAHYEHELNEFLEGADAD